jgi:hypothetical protein
MKEKLGAMPSFLHENVVEESPLFFPECGEEEGWFLPQNPLFFQKTLNPSVNFAPF